MPAVTCFLKVVQAGSRSLHVKSQYLGGRARHFLVQRQLGLQKKVPGQPELHDETLFLSKKKKSIKNDSFMYMCNLIDVALVIKYSLFPVTSIFANEYLLF